MQSTTPPPPQLPSMACRPLSKHEHSMYMNICTSSCQGLIENALSLARSPVSSTLHCGTTMRDATIHRGRDVVDMSLVALCAVTKLEATLSEVAAQYALLPTDQAMDSPHMVDMERRHRSILGSHVVARKQLYCLGGATPAMPLHYAGLVWYVHAASLPLCARRDFCVLELGM
ncbi:hypothetical protein H257_12732 [Aphanomyces astaci]|uniref:Uncharacterized protein n=1 Tax=Aphanomyces astaci TaxID=112090 RepID=W4FZ51_APHAT|nr:hypothetical protein H257_12732 [Aphanomyces astaci]ETV72271.1 hypothetical protein H257_12732 [Aphanomyces astaci]|eukprot:XP_009838339.1 hypothetical protein H257_12732 [Aphanomyces astaci]